MRKTLLLIGLAGLIPALGAQASDLRMTVETPHFTCEGARNSLSRVAFRPDDPSTPAPLPCCDGKIGCAQFLSTNTVVRQSHEWRG